MRKLNDYVVTLTEVGGVRVQAIRADGFECKTDLILWLIANYVGWNVKSILRLYESDFKEAL